MDKLLVGDFHRGNPRLEILQAVMEVIRSVSIRRPLDWIFREYFLSRGNVQSEIRESIDQRT